MQGKCNGQCLAGVIVAVIFGALFLLFVVEGFRTQFTAGMSEAATEVYINYIIGLVFLAIAKMAKMWSMNCPHCMPAVAEKKGRK